MEEKAGKPIAQCFDLLAGTSIGGIIALALALEVPANQIREAFEKHGQHIFSSRPAPKSTIDKVINLSRSLFAPKYQQDGLRKALKEFIDPSALMGDLKHPTVIPTINVTKGKPQIFKTPHHVRFERDHRAAVYEVALATSAAPTFFPLAQVGDEWFTDGGLFANMPDSVALHEAEYFLQIPTERISILSVGTTSSNFSFSHGAGRNLGILGWFYNERLLSVIMSSQQMMSKYVSQHKLAERYVRVDSVQSVAQKQDLGLDVATPAARSTLKGLAHAALREAISNPELQLMLNHVPPAPRFFYGRFSTIYAINRKCYLARLNKSNHKK